MKPSRTSLKSRIRLLALVAGAWLMAASCWLAYDLQTGKPLEF